MVHVPPARCVIVLTMLGHDHKNYIVVEQDPVALMIAVT